MFNKKKSTGEQGVGNSVPERKSRLGKEKEINNNQNQQVNWALETLYLEENAVVENGKGALALQNVLRSTFRLRSKKTKRKIKGKKSVENGQGDHIH